MVCEKGLSGGRWPGQHMWQAINWGLTGYAGGTGLDRYDAFACLIEYSGELSISSPENLLWVRTFKAVCKRPKKPAEVWCGERLIYRFVACKICWLAGWLARWRTNEEAGLALDYAPVDRWSKPHANKKPLTYMSDRGSSVASCKVIVRVSIDDWVHWLLTMIVYPRAPWYPRPAALTCWLLPEVS
jgi:hypothetical protein